MIHIQVYTSTYPNVHANSNTTKAPSYACNSKGAWGSTSITNKKQFIALIFYQGLVGVSIYHQCWSTKSLYHELCTRTFMSCDRCKVLLAMLHVVVHTDEKRVH